MPFKSHAAAIDVPYLHRFLARLVGTRSVNPFFDPDSPGEGAVAAVVLAEASALGMATNRLEAEPGRVSVVARLPGRGDGPTLMLYAHHDTVGVSGMSEPFSAEIRDGRLYGRGSYDMKCGLAACFAAVRAIRDAGIVLAGDLLVASVADEEAASIGIADVLATTYADAAIVTEPTELQLVVAHKGFAWLEIETLGVAAHGSLPEEGVDANMHMGRVLARLERLGHQLRASASHSLLGTPSLHAGVIAGGTGPSTYAGRCTLQIEWRMLPHESESTVLVMVEEILAGLRAEDPRFRASVRTTLVRPPFEIAPDHPVVHLVRDQAGAVLGRSPDEVGAPYWLDASLIAEAGIPVVVFGPSGAGAHAEVEWVDLESVRQVSQILAQAAVTFCGEVPPESGQ